MYYHGGGKNLSEQKSKTKIRLELPASALRGGPHTRPPFLEWTIRQQLWHGNRTPGRLPLDVTLWLSCLCYFATLAAVMALGEPSAILVGHDWGAILTWQLGLLHPSRFTALCAMSVPPILFDSPVPLRLLCLPSGFHH